MALFFALIGLALAPLFAGLFHWGHEFMPSRPWNSASALVYILSAVLLAILMRGIWSVGLVLRRSAPPGSIPTRPPMSDWKRAVAGLVALLALFYWFENMQAVVLPKLFHSFAVREDAVLRFTSQGKTNLSRRACDTVVVNTQEYGDFALCMPDRDHLYKSASGRLRGTRSFYGFWVEAIAFDD